jgi:hypothetical protein
MEFAPAEKILDLMGMLQLNLRALAKIKQWSTWTTSLSAVRCFPNPAQNNGNAICLDNQLH